MKILFNLPLISCTELVFCILFNYTFEYNFHWYNTIHCSMNKCAIQILLFACFIISFDRLIINATTANYCNGCVITFVLISYCSRCKWYKVARVDQLFKFFFTILYLKFKLSNQKASFVPREHDIYREITAFNHVFDGGWFDSRNPRVHGYMQQQRRGMLQCIKWPTRKKTFYALAYCQYNFFGIIYHL
jgi:hypothetical protein